MMMRDFKKRFLVSLILTIPILTLSPMLQTWFHYSFRFLGDLYVLFFLSSIVYFYGGFPFLKGLFVEITKKQIGMMSLIAVAITVAYVYSSFVVFGIEGDIFFWELVTLIDIMLLGHLIEMKSVIGASRSLELLVKLMPSKANLIKNGKITKVDIKKLKVNDLVLVKPSEKVPSDGIIIEGSSYLNESFLTGEAKPVKKEKGFSVIGGSINTKGSLKIKISHLGKESYLAKIIKLVKEAQISKSKTQKLADVAAKWLTIIAVTVALITLASWILIGKGLAFSLQRMVTVMVISCPHALGLAIPLVCAVSTTLSAKYGLLIRNRKAFENARKISTVVFDKTGTLTKGNFVIKKYKSFLKNYSDEDILKIAASVESHSEHPIAQSVLEKIKQKKITILPIKNFKSIPGKGIEAEVNRKKVKIVGLKYLKKHQIALDKILPTAAETLIFIIINSKLAGFISLADEIRKESFEAIKSLKKMGIKTIMITGDNEKVAKEVSKELELDGYFANTLPHEKLKIVKNLQKKGEFIAMTGDGVNDAPALAKANVGIAIGSGTDIAAETADIILVKSSPLDILALILFGKATYNKMVQNLIWATGYNLVAIPLAAGVLYSYKIIISPAIGAIFMSLSTIIVAINARLLKASKALKLIKKT